MKNVSGSMGAAIMAASQTHFKDLVTATQAMTHLEKEYLPEFELSSSYDIHYNEFIALLKQKNYIKKEDNYA